METSPSDQTKLASARECLYLSHVPDTLPCRENEFEELYIHLADQICEDISGVPGTGKTATVHSVVNALKNQCESGEIPPFQLVEINGMKLTEPIQAYQVLWESLTGSKVAPNQAMELLEKRFSSPSANRQPVVLILDELDQILNKTQKVVYNFFDWPNRHHSRLIVVSIANTMDLPERAMENKIASRLDMKRITFMPYTFQQLSEIISSRVSRINVFEKDAIELCARKVGAVSGDARRALTICRRAVEILEESPTPNEQVTIPIIQKVINEMFSSTNVQSIKKCSIYQRIFLVSIFRVSLMDGKPEVIISDVIYEMDKNCQLQSLAKLNQYELYSICLFLYSYRLILCESNKMGDPLQKIRLNIGEDDLKSALMVDTVENEFLRKMIEK